MPLNNKQQEWLDAISEHAQTAEAARSIAEDAFGKDHHLTRQPPELISRLVELGFLHREPGGRYITKFPGPFI